MGHSVLAAAHLPVTDGEIAQRPGEVGEEGGVVAGQVAVELDGFLGGGQGVLAAAHLAVADAEVVQRPGEVGEEGGVVAGQVAVELDGLLGGRNCVLAKPPLPHAVGDLQGRHGDVGLQRAVFRGQLPQYRKPGRARISCMAPQVTPQVTGISSINPPCQQPLIPGRQRLRHR